MPRWMKLGVAASTLVALVACEDQPGGIFGDTADVMGLPVCSMFFKFDSIEIHEGDQLIEGCAKQMKVFGGDKRFVIEAITDRSGSESYNRDLSLRRGNAVKEALARHGINASNLEVRPLGESDPMLKFEDGTRDPQSRRVEIREACPGGMQGVGWGGTPNCR